MIPFTLIFNLTNHFKHHLSATALLMYIITVSKLSTASCNISALPEDTMRYGGFLPESIPTFKVTPKFVILVRK